MLLKYKRAKEDLKNKSELNIKYAITGTYTGYTLLATFLVVTISYLIVNYFKLPSFVFFIIYWLAIFFCIVNIISRKCAIGMTDDSILILKYYNIGRSIKSVDDIKLDKITSLSHFKFFNYFFETIFYINNTNKIKKVKIIYKIKKHGVFGEEQENNAKNITNILLELQKKLDKGDF